MNTQTQPAKKLAVKKQSVRVLSASSPEQLSKSQRRITADGPTADC